MNLASNPARQHVPWNRSKSIKRKGPAFAGPREMARPAGLEPTTPWFVDDLGHFVVLGNQRLAALANSLASHIKAQFGHK
jgi:hypothetical protein